MTDVTFIKMRGRPDGLRVQGPVAEIEAQLADAHKSDTVAILTMEDGVPRQFDPEHVEFCDEAI